LKKNRPDAGGKRENKIGQRVKGKESKGLKSPAGNAHHPKPEVVAAVDGVVADAVRHTAVIWVVVPGTAARKPTMILIIIN